MTETKSPNVPKTPPQEQDYAPSLPDMSMAPPVDRGSEVVATHLSPQLGSSVKFLGQGDFDMRILSVINEKDIPLLIYARIKAKKSSTWQMIYSEFLHLQISVNGRGRRDIIRMEGVSKGGLPDTEPLPEKPGWIERNLTNRNWKREQEKEQM